MELQVFQISEKKFLSSRYCWFHEWAGIRRTLPDREPASRKGEGTDHILRGWIDASGRRAGAYMGGAFHLRSVFCSSSALLSPSDWIRNKPKIFWHVLTQSLKKEALIRKTWIEESASHPTSSLLLGRGAPSSFTISINFWFWTYFAKFYSQ